MLSVPISISVKRLHADIAVKITCCLSEKANNQSVRRHLDAFTRNHWEVGGRPQCDSESSELLTASFHDVSNYRNSMGVQ
ncbi:hypothetical protein TNCV_4446001 [Trichonephila clavipes]|nr:hypothetical protein TNCV_4446001 [Trichonephila clavipes]